ncbi:MAG: hypothetical protein CVV53_04360 [Spirochaetae bacterium HGW-Spirochaetae-9]|nr:MAG: hypothetical protein CVV53_04360 [Spirochaetae bacterium HGW-Spirochaetae-9]
MNRAARTAIFVIAASLGNILVTGVIFVACLGIYSLTLGRWLSPTAVMWAVVASFLIAMVGAFFLYKKALSFAQKRFNLEERLGLSSIPKKPRD